MSDLVAPFLELFEGRRDAYGKDHGEAVRGVHKDAWPKLVKYHLSGGAGLGVYPLREDNTCRWGCVDLDIKPKPSADYDTADDAHTAALNLVNALLHFNLTGWVEQSKSGGYHVWVFAEEWVPGGTMRDALRAACAIADVPPREVNPKQRELAPGGLGNYVRCPYAGPSSREIEFVNSSKPMSVGAFVKAALNTRAPLKNLEWLADLAEPESGRADYPTLDGTEPLDLRNLSGLTYWIWKNGPLEGKGRNETLFKLAIHAFKDGLDPSQALRLVASADRAWGKFSDRPDGALRLGRLVMDAKAAADAESANELADAEPDAAH